MAFLLPLLFGSVAAAVIFINSTGNNDIIPNDIPNDIPDQDIDTAITQVLRPGPADLPSRPRGPPPAPAPASPAPVTFSYTPPPSEYGRGYDQYGNFDIGSLD